LLAGLNALTASALSILDTWLTPGVTRSALDACDVTALLWRLSTDGVDVASRFRTVSDAFEESVTPGFWPFIDLHAALAHVCAGDHARASRLAQAIARCAKVGDYSGVRARHITQPGLAALSAWAEGRYGEAAVLLAGLRRILSCGGGSRVQLEVFKSIEREAVRRHRARGNRVHKESVAQRVMPPTDGDGVEKALPDEHISRAKSPSTTASYPAH